jgi:hypothetical protein
MRGWIKRDRQHFMSIVITLSPELEQQLQAKATRQGQDINLVATELLTSVLESESQDSADAVKFRYLHLLQSRQSDFFTPAC